MPGTRQSFPGLYYWSCRVSIRGWGRYHGEAFAPVHQPVQRERVTFVPFLASSETLHVKACGQQLNVFKCVLSRSASLLCLGLQGRLSRDRDRQETQNLESTYLLVIVSPAS